MYQYSMSSCPPHKLQSIELSFVESLTIESSSIEHSFVESLTVGSSSIKLSSRLNWASSPTTILWSTFLLKLSSRFATPSLPQCLLLFFRAYWNISLKTSSQMRGTYKLMKTPQLHKRSNYMDRTSHLRKIRKTRQITVETVERDYDVHR